MTTESPAIAVCLTLYVVGGLPGSVDLAAAVRSTLLATLPEGSWRLEVVDVLESPERALEAEVFATPTLVRNRPGPVAKLLGDLSRPGDILALLRYGDAESPSLIR